MVEGKGLPGPAHLGQGSVDPQGGPGVHHLASEAVPWGEEGVADSQGVVVHVHPMTSCSSIIESVTGTRSPSNSLVPRTRGLGMRLT